MSRRIVDLNGVDWRLGQAPEDAAPDQPAWDELERVTRWLPARVPGNVRADLCCAGELPPLNPGTQVEASRWVDKACWWLIREFALSPSPGQRVHLVLHGVDYVGDVYLNGQHLARHEGMFSTQCFEVTDLLEDQNCLAVRIAGSAWLPQDKSTSWEKFLNIFEARAASLSTRFPHRRDVLKCQMSFGWDFAPPVLTMGIWDDVVAIVSGDVHLRQVVVRQEHDRDAVNVEVGVELDARHARSVQVRCRLRAETFEAESLLAQRSVDLAAGSSWQAVEILVSEPQLWWPWDHGRPDLYCLLVEIWDGQQLLDSVEQTVGLRKVTLDGWTLRVNDRPVYARGANWVPADILPGRVTAADYDDLLSLARQANMNMLRVWGGGLREKQAFYDLCDRLGILVWQELPFACAFLSRFPRSKSYLRLVEAETGAIVRSLRNHASLAVWCGGNEFDPGRNEPLVSTLQRVVQDEDPTRPFLPASPANGDSHNWRVWHNFEPPSAYRQDGASFASEFGLQAAPGTGALERFVPEEELWPPGPAWAYHGADMEKLRRYAQPFLKEGATSLRSFVQAGQRAQAHGLQIGIEHYRRHKAKGCGGVLLWQLNEPWPAISWAIIDYYREPKAAYETVKRILSPVLVSVDLPLQCYGAGDSVQASVWIVNDLAAALPNAQVEVLLWDSSGTVEKLLDQTVAVAAHSAEVVGWIDGTLSVAGGWRLACQLVQGDELLSRNEYDLTVHDDISPSWGQRLWRWTSSLVMPS